MSDEPRGRVEPAGTPERRGRPSAGDREAAIEQTLDDLEELLNDIGARIGLIAQQATPDRVRGAREDVLGMVGLAGERARRLSGAALPESSRRAVADAELALRNASGQLRETARSRTPEQLRVSARQAELLVRRAGSNVHVARFGFRATLVRGLSQVDGAIDRGQERLFRVLWFTLPPGSIARNIHFQALLVSRFFSDIAMQALLYGALIAAARDGEGALGAALIGTAYLLPGVVLGLYGGAIADALPKRVALVGAYLAMGLACLAVALVAGTGFVALLAVLFVVRALHQVSQPSEASAVPLVADADELAAANSLLSLSSSIGDVIGKALLAPTLVRVAGVRPVVAIAGVFFWLATTRVFDLALPKEAEARDRAAASPARSTLEAVAWLVAERQVLWMLLLASIASTVGVVLGVLGPEYTGEALQVDPANALYVFMPAALGLVVALALAPPLIARFEERPVAAAGFVLSAITMAAFGQVARVTDAVQQIVEPGRFGLSDELVVAAALSVPLGAGITLAAAATQTYLGRHVPAEIRGRAFALLGALKDGLSIAPLLAMGALAGVLGVEAVITLAPLVLLVLALAVDAAAGRVRTPPLRA